MAYGFVVCSVIVTGLLVDSLITSNMGDPSASPSDLDTSFAQSILIAAIIPTTLSATVAGLRFATRAWIVKGLAWDDYAMMMAIVRAATGL